MKFFWSGKKEAKKARAKPPKRPFKKPIGFRKMGPGNGNAWSRILGNFVREHGFLLTRESEGCFWRDALPAFSA